MKLTLFRLLAYSIDFFILASIFVGLQWLLYYGTDGFPFNQFTSAPIIFLWVALTISLPVWLYFIFTEKSEQQATLGKRLLNLKVSDSNGEKITSKQAIIRTAIRLLPWELTHISLIPIYMSDNPDINIGIWIADFLIVLYMVILITSNGQSTLHDRFAATKVVSEGAK